MQSGKLDWIRVRHIGRSVVREGRIGLIRIHVANDDSEG